MATAIYICPQCGCPDLVEPKRSAIVLPAKDRNVHCPNCKWEGSLDQAAGIATTERVYDSRAVLNLLLYVVTKHATGPVAQALVFIGLLDPKDQDGLDHIMREATAGMIERAFVAAAEVAAKAGTPISINSPTVESVDAGIESRSSEFHSHGQAALNKIDRRILLDVIDRRLAELAVVQIIDGEEERHFLRHLHELFEEKP